MMKPSDVFDMFRRKGGARCVEVGRQIQTYLDGELDETAAVKVSSHLAACRRCGLSAHDYRTLKSALADERVPLPAGSLERLQVFAAELAAADGRR